MDKKLFIHLQGGRKVSGTLRGYDLFLNLVIDDALEETSPAQKHPIGTVVRLTHAAALAHSQSSFSHHRLSVAIA
jgi:small nuclear ribonucleoprotein (snRNP)-like protein